MPAVRLVAGLAAACCFVTAGGPVRAAPHEINVFTDEIEEPGHVGLEMHVNFARGRGVPDFASEIPPDRSLRVMPELVIGLGNRWEFNVKKLFDHTNYMAERCKDLYTAAQALEHFHNILGNELKAVTGDAEGINAVMEEVKNSVNHLESVAFDVFDKRFNTSWDALMSQFNAAIVEIEDNTKVSPALPACAQSLLAAHGRASE